jgi:glucose/arabinose dehydrogenase
MKFLSQKIFLIFLLWLAVGIVPSAAQQSEVFSDIPTNILYRVERYVLANFPVGMVFAPDGRLFYNEKTTGNVRVVMPDGKQQIEPVISFPTDSLQERGMLGIALDPDFENNSLMYIVHTRVGTARDYPSNQLVRFRLEDNRGVDPEVLLSMPITTGDLLHNGGNVHFDRDGYLYLSTGDNGDAANGQDLSVMQAKIHRFQVTPEGLQPAPGNPFGDDSSVFAYGLRNPFDFTFDPYTGNIFAAEVGPNCDDEIDLILPGYNYGWSDTYDCPGMEPITGLPDPYGIPLITTGKNEVEAPTGILVYDHDTFEAWKGSLFYCNWVNGKMRRVVLDETRLQIETIYDIDTGDTGCRIDLVIGPEGGLYYSTVGDFGGAIMRLVPFE